MQQSASEHAALIWTRSSTTTRARGIVDGRITRPDTCQHPTARQTRLQNPLLRMGRLYMLRKACLGFALLIQRHSWTACPSLHPPGAVARSGGRTALPFPRLTSVNGLGDGNVEGGEAVEDGNADLELGGLAVEVARHQPLTQEFHAVHLGLDAAAAVVA